MRPSSPIRPILQHTGRPGQDNGAETLDGDDVHPLVQVHLCTLETFQPSDCVFDHGVNGGFMAEEVGGLVDGSNEAALKTVALCVALGEEVQVVWEERAEKSVDYGFGEGCGDCRTCK